MSIAPSKTLPYGVRKRKVGHWNIYTSEDMIRGVTRIQNSRLKTDGRYGNRTISATGIACDDSYSTVTVNAPSQAEMKPFYCPNCGGNSYRKVNGKIVCDYCDTEFLTSTIPSENPLKDLRPKPIPTRTTR